MRSLSLFVVVQYCGSRRRDDVLAAGHQARCAKHEPAVENRAARNVTNCIQERTGQLHARKLVAELLRRNRADRPRRHRCLDHLDDLALAIAAGTAQEHRALIPSREPEQACARELSDERDSSVGVSIVTKASAQHCDRAMRL
jgi:hypothetical protein